MQDLKIISMLYSILKKSIPFQKHQCTRLVKKNGNSEMRKIQNKVKKNKPKTEPKRKFKNIRSRSFTFERMFNIQDVPQIKELERAKIAPKLFDGFNVTMLPFEIITKTPKKTNN